MVSLKSQDLRMFNVPQKKRATPNPLKLWSRRRLFATYTVEKKIIEINTNWVKIVGEQVWDKKKGQFLDYWRIEKDNSLIVIPLFKNQFVLPDLVYRHAINRSTYDFPGGRIPHGSDIQLETIKILKREIGISQDNIHDIKQLNSEGWPINSAFSNQELFCTVATMSESINVRELKNIELFPCSKKGIMGLRKKLLCLQCRAALLEWCFINNVNSKF